jgi:two-component system, LytTR family, sensor histidine kinase AlgZ
MPISSRKQSLQYLIHTIVWGIIIIFPLIFLYSEGERNTLRYIDFSLPIFFLMIVFYSNYLFLISRFLFKRKLLQFFLVNLLMFAICLFILSIIKSFLFNDYFAKMEIAKHMPPKGKMMNILLFRDAISMSMTVGLATAIKMTTQWYHAQAEQQEMERLHIESELNNLKHQLNPHFLFNTLNNIYSLISTNQENAQNAVHQLSNLIRYVLYESDHKTVPLEKDLKFTANYIHLMSLRLSSNVKLTTELLKPDESAVIEPLLFIALVENAFKHGIHPSLASFINIRILKENDSLICRVENSNFPKAESDQSGSGIGLVNLRKRLELIYPGRFKLSVSETNETYTTTLKLML